LLGNNGSGKTTLMHALAGIRRPIAGEVRLDGTPLSMLGATARARRIGLLLQEESVEFWGSVLDYACLGRYPHRRSLFGWEAEDERLAREQLEIAGGRDDPRIHHLTINAWVGHGQSC
jgi:iron complex transport system ATP-binding protein